MAELLLRRAVLEHVSLGEQARPVDRTAQPHRQEELLITTDDKVEVIGYEVGYSSPYVFSTAFKRFFSIPPSEYRFSNKIE